MSNREIIFHEYPVSPFAEKIRRIFGYKKIAYRSVEQPMWMPKPQLTPLTAGYRRIPVLQIGADIYCDTTRIVRKLEELYPEPTVFPDANPAAAEAIAAWADRGLFQACVPVVFNALASMLPPELLADRAKMRPDMTPEKLAAVAPQGAAVLSAACDRFNTTLTTHDFVLGSAMSVADAALYHCLWFSRNTPEGGETIVGAPAVVSWMARLEAMGSGDLTPMDPSEALDIARDATPEPATTSDGSGDGEFAPGTSVEIAADDLPNDVFTGVVISSGRHEVVIRHEDSQLGELALHFPRSGYLVRAV